MAVGERRGLVDSCPAGFGNRHKLSNHSPAQRLPAPLRPPLRSFKLLSLILKSCLFFVSPVRQREI